MIQAYSPERAFEKRLGYYTFAYEIHYLNADLRQVRWKVVGMVDDYQCIPKQSQKLWKIA